MGNANSFSMILVSSFVKRNYRVVDIFSWWYPNIKKAAKGSGGCSPITAQNNGS